VKKRRSNDAVIIVPRNHQVVNVQRKRRESKSVDHTPRSVLVIRRKTIVAFLYSRRNDLQPRKTQSGRRQAVVMTPPRYTRVWSECEFRGSLRSTTTKRIIVVGRMKAAS